MVVVVLVLTLLLVFVLIYKSFCSRSKSSRVGWTACAAARGDAQGSAARIPGDIDWVLRVDGHTDRRPIHTSEFPSNWELSTARALSIVRFLIGEGVPQRRLIAAGFGEFRPLDSANTPEAWQRNRRIELRLTLP